MTADNPTIDAPAIDAKPEPLRAELVSIDTTPGRPPRLELRDADRRPLAYIDLNEYLAQAVAADLQLCWLVPRGYTPPWGVRADGKVVFEPILPTAVAGAMRKH